MADKEYYEREAVIEFIRSYRCCTDVAFHMEKHLNEIPAADVRSTEYCEECRAALLETIDRYKQLCADARPVVRAHWYWDKDGMDWGIGAWRCSECHARPETWWQGDSTNPRNKSGHYFCPNCGADMREES